MKHLILALSLLTGFQIANAQEIQPSKPIESLLAQKTVYGGMPIPGGRSSHTLSVYTDGEIAIDDVYAPKDFSDPNAQPREVHSQLPELAASDLDQLRRVVAEIKGGKLTQPNGPICEDAPRLGYIVDKGLAQSTEVLAYEGCRAIEFVDLHQRALALTVKNMLDRLDRETPQN